MTEDHQAARGKAAFIAELRNLHERCGRPYYSKLAAISEDLPQLYPPSEGVECRYVTLSVSAISEILGGSGRGCRASTGSPVSSCAASGGRWKSMPQPRTPASAPCPNGRDAGQRTHARTTLGRPTMARPKQAAVSRSGRMPARGSHRTEEPRRARTSAPVPLEYSMGVVDLRCGRRAGRGGVWLAGCCSRSPTC